MGFEPTVYTALYALAFVLSIVTVFYAYPARTSAGGRWLLLMTWAIAAWCFAEMIDFSAVAVSAHLLGAQLSYLGATTAPVFFFLFTLEYSSTVKRVPRRAAAALLAPSVITIALAFTNSMHRLVWTSFEHMSDGSNVIIYGHGPAYWFITVYALLLGAAGMLLVGLSAVRSSGIFRTRAVLIIAAGLLPWAAQLLYSVSPRAVVGLDPSIALSVTCALIVMAISRYQLLELVAVPKELMVEQMTDGMLVFDAGGALLEINPAGIELLGLKRTDRHQITDPTHLTRVGDPRSRVDLGDLATTTDVRFETADGRILDAVRSEVAVGDAAGPRRLLMLRDVTAQVGAERALRASYIEQEARLAQIEALQAQLIEQATRDALTGLHNRRFLDEQLEPVLANARRASLSVAVVMFDVDYFKELNDARGHAAGDEALIAVAAVLSADTRRGDIICRYGGDEFVVIMPAATRDAATQRAQHWQQALRDSACEACDGLTISVGVAVYPHDGATADALLAAADVAVYEAKRAGRDAVVVAS